MSKSTLLIDTPKTCGDCPFCIFTAEEKRYIGYCHTSDDDYYCKALDRFMEYDKVDGGVDILEKPTDCPLQEESMDGERGSIYYGGYSDGYKDDLNDVKKYYTTMVISQGKWRCTQCDQLHFNTKSTKPMYCSNCGKKVKEYIK